MGTNGGGRTVLECLMHKLPASRKSYYVRLVVPDSGNPFIDYRHVSNFVGSKKAAKAIELTNMLFADKRHESNDKFAFSIYTIDKTITFLPRDEGVMDEWLTKIRELHTLLYPEFKHYDSIFEARLLDKGLATTMHIQGHYRVALCKDSLDLIPLLTIQDQQQQQNSNFKIPNANTSASSSSTTTTASTVSSNSSTQNHHHHHHHHHPLVHHHETNLPNNFNSSHLIDHHNHSSKLNQTQPHHLVHHLPSHHLPSSQRFCKRHPRLASKTIELALKCIRRCGHNQENLFIESGRHSQIGEGHLWMALNKKSTAQMLHKLLLTTMRLAPATEEQYLFKAPRSRSGSSSDNAHRAQQSRSSSLLCLNADSPNASSTVTPATATINGNEIQVNTNISNSSTPVTTPTSMQSGFNGNPAYGSGGGSFLSSLFGSHPHQQLSPAGGIASSEKSLAAEISQAAAINSISTIPMYPNHDNNNIDEDSGYLPMA